MKYPKILFNNYDLEILTYLKRFNGGTKKGLALALLCHPLTIYNHTLKLLTLKLIKRTKPNYNSTGQFRNYIYTLTDNGKLIYSIFDEGYNEGAFI